MSDATRVAIVGLGAIGGSAALKLIEGGVVPRGFAAGEEDRRLAAAAGVRVAETVEAAVQNAELVLIAVPLDRLADVARRVVASTPDITTVLHAGSLQGQSATMMIADADQARVIGTHPLAGSSRGGFGGARADMFRGATVFAEPRGTRRNREDAERFWKMLGATRIEFLEADEHDARMAAVSHLPQLLATVLASMLAKSGMDPTALGPGGRDMTRLATSPWTMWAPLLAAAPNRTVALLETFAGELSSLSAAIGSRDASGLESTWNRASSWRDGVER